MIYGDLACCAIGKARYVRTGTFKTSGGKSVNYVAFKLDVKVKGHNVLIPFMVSDDRNKQVWNSLQDVQLEGQNFFVNFGITNVKEIENGVNKWRNGFELLTIAPTDNDSELSGQVVCLDYGNKVGF